VEVEHCGPFGAPALRHLRPEDVWPILLPAVPLSGRPLPAEPLRFYRSGALAAALLTRASRAVIGGHFGLPSRVPLAGSIALPAMGHGRAHASLRTLANPAIQIAQRGGDGVEPVPQADDVEGLSFHVHLTSVATTLPAIFSRQ